MNDKAIINAVLEYYKLEINCPMPSVISPIEDPDLVCCVMDRVKEGKFYTHVLYGKGQYYSASVNHVINALKKSRIFKELTPSGDTLPKFKYVGSKL